MPVNSTDQALIFAAKNGNDACFEELYKRYYDKIYALAKTTVHSDDDAQDVLQATFIKAWKNLQSLEDPSAFNTWLGRIALNECYTLLRRSKPALSIDEEGEEGEVMQLESDLMLPAQYAERGDLSKRLWKIVSELSDVQRETVVLYYYEEMSVEEIAATMDCSPGTVKSRLFLARKALKTEIEEQERRSGEKFYGLALPFGGIFVRQIRSTMLPQGEAMQIYGKIANALFGTAARAGTVSSAVSASAQTAAAPSQAAASGARAAAAVANTAAKTAAGGAAKAAGGTVAKALWLKVTAGIVAGAIAVSSAAYGTTKAIQTIGEAVFPSYSTTTTKTPAQESSLFEGSLSESSGENVPEEPQQRLQEVDPDSLPESLTLFLNQFLFGYLDENDGREYDCERPNWRLISRIASSGSCVRLSEYPGNVVEVHSDELDPLGRYYDKNYISYSEESILWIAENIFHTGADRARELLDYALMTDLNLYEYTVNGEKRLCNRMYGVGGPAYVITFTSVLTDGERYYVNYERTIEDSDAYLERCYAELSEITFNGKSYWTLYRHSAQTPAEIRVSLPQGYSEAYRAYIGALEAHYDAIFGAEKQTGGRLVAISDIYGSDTPELIFFESENGSYDYPRLMTVLTFEDGALKTLYSGKPAEYLYSFALFRRENEKTLWLCDYQIVVDSGHTILTSFEEENGALVPRERAYFTAMYNMEDSSNYHYDYVWRVEGSECDEETFTAAQSELLRGAQESLIKTELYDFDAGFLSLPDRSLTVDEAIDYLYELLGEARPKESQGEIFSKFAGSYVFTSGLGGWATTMILNADGTFSGGYTDTNYVGGENHDVEILESVFTGRFENARRIDGVTYAFDLAQIEYEHTPGEQELREINGTKALVYYYSAYGLDTGTKTVYAYTANARWYSLPEKLRDWINLGRADRYSGTLDYCALYSLEAGFGWTGPKADAQ